MQVVTIEELISTVRRVSESALQEYVRGNISSAKAYAISGHESFRFIMIYF